MYHTAWTKSSSLPSDRLPPSRPRQSTPPTKGKGKQTAQEPPKSKEVRRLESLRNSLKNSSGKESDPKGGCFCQARVHPLSPYTPICRSCGLVLCALQPPHCACPHCQAPLLAPSARDALLATLDAQIADTLAREQAARERAAQEARAAAGAFPTLSAAATTATTDALATHPANQAHKVLSLNANTKKVTVKTYTPPAAASRSASRDGSPRKEDEEPTRVPPPPAEVICARRGSEAQSPWANFRGGGALYVPPPGGKRERRKGRGGR